MTPYVATANGAYPNVFNNAAVDGSFGVTAPIFIDQLTRSGSYVNTIAVDPTKLVTSFPSKSELGINLSTDQTQLTFTGYSSTINQLDVSNSRLCTHCADHGVSDSSCPGGLGSWRTCFG